MGADPEGQLAGQVGQIRGKGGRFADQLAGQIHHIPQRLGDLVRQILKHVVAGAGIVLDPADHGDAERSFPDHLKHPEALLAEGDDVAAIIVLGLALKNFRAAAHLGHVLLVRVPAHHAETTVGVQHRLQHHAVAGLEDMQGKHFLREQHHIRQGEEWEFPHGQISHGRCAGRQRVVGGAGWSAETFRRV